MHGLREFALRTHVDMADGALLVFAYGTPPTWVETSAAAELWALLCMLQIAPEQPATVTDCNGIPDAAAGPGQLAMTGSMPDFGA